MPTDVLLYGRDAALLATRQLLLENHGYETSATTELEDVQRMLSHENVKLLILGHTLSLEDIGRALALSQSLQSSAKYLFLINAQSAQDSESSAETFNVSRGPAQFIARVQQMLSSPPPMETRKSTPAVPDSTQKSLQPVRSRPELSTATAR
jgi:DNA-binding NtrC family response regulator